MDTKTAVTSLAALAQQTRLSVFRTLVERGPLGASPGELIEMLGIAPATLSFHLKELCHSDLVHAEQRGRSIRYRADMSAIRNLVDYLTQNCCAGNPGLCEPSCGPTGARAAVSKTPRAASPRKVNVVVAGKAGRSRVAATRRVRK